ncbi:hypothetical protein L202_01090 [Cryptococcus amylolentus CBS 6039]|uniref:Protein MON2 homolog n=2 Tax=Cryptococcus amylolentus CBS 6039 TaxID=1295533 RepID=A0A1E3I2F6_9TREE|nr:hypothetical protein L202_01090 [Cryptococcus amylolentus CBS 6039]ODN82823.1 hypothetical protein L202_01090 [Cryptococcus amylolentus CBS 6039]
MDHNLLISELQALAVETKRRNPEVKDASEAALVVLKDGPLPRHTLLDNADTLLSPVTLGCKTKTAKVIGISIAALQRLVALGGVPILKLPEVLGTLSSVANQAVDIQLKILQTLLSILTFNKDVHDEVLGNTLLLCFKLQDSRVSVVSSTAAATLRQAVMLIFDRLSSTHLSPSLTPSEPPTPSTVPLTLPSEPPQTLQVTPSAMDAYSIFSDLCILAASAGAHGSTFGGLWKGGDAEKPKLLKLHNLQRTFALELIESILSGYESGVKKRPELLFLLQHSLHPLLLRLLSEKPTFPIALRVCRLIFLLIRSFIDQLPGEIEIYLASLIKIGAGEHEGDDKVKENTPPWLRVLALEILRGICGDHALLQSTYTHFDEAGGSVLFAKIINALGRLINEKPALLGMGSQMHGLGVPTGVQADASGSNPSLHGGYLDMGLGMLGSAASAGVSTMNAMMAGPSGGGLGQHSGMKLKLIEQHDKSDAPIFPETYIYLLAFQSLNTIAQGIYTVVTSKDPPPTCLQGMASSAWPALLAALSYSIGTNLSDTLFAEVLTALQDFTVACGWLKLGTPRDAFLNTLGKYAVPPPAVSAMQTYIEAPGQRNAGGIAADALGFASSLAGNAPPVGPPSLSDRNLACLRSAINTARVLGPTLGKAWHDVLEILQNANFMMSVSKQSAPRRYGGVGGSPKKAPPPTLGRVGEIVEPKPPILQDLEPESIQQLINGLFDSSKDLPDEAFTTFVTALCQLSSEMIGMETSQTSFFPDNASEVSLPPTPSSSAIFSPPLDNRRRTSGINVSHGIKSVERSFSLTKLKSVSTRNLKRIVTKEPAVGWDAITQHLLAVARHPTAPSTIRVQASETLGELLLAAVRVGKESRTQHQVFDVLVRQVDAQPISNSLATDFDVRSSGYQTLNHLLESSGHSLQVGWGMIFDMLDGVCRDDKVNEEQPGDTSSESRRPATVSSKGNSNLVRIAFPSLTIICTDFLSSLDDDSLRQCIVSLGYFGAQKEDVNIALAAIGLLWNVSDAVQRDSKELWLYLLTQLLALGHDGRLDVRNSAIQTLFRCIEIYGSGLTSALWQDVLWKVIFPLIEAAEGGETQVLALTSVGSVFGSFLTLIADLDSFDKAFQRFLDRVRHAFTSQARACCTAGLKALEKVLMAADASRIPLGDTMQKIVDASWLSFVDMGNTFTDGEPYTQENLIALTRVGSLLHDDLAPHDTERLTQFASILRSIMTYIRSPDLRPDNDVMSPLQTSLCEIIANSKLLGPHLVLSSLADFAALAYVGVVGQRDAGTKLTYVALSKWSMRKIEDVFEESPKNKELYDDGTVESVIGMYSIPIKLKYDCPPANRFGDDPPLWRSATLAFSSILGWVIATLDIEDIESEKMERLWAQIMEVFGGMLSADSSGDVASDDETFVVDHLTRMRDIVIPRLGHSFVPDRVISHFADVLSRASHLYQYDVRVSGGTTAPALPTTQEELRYWAFDLLVTLSVQGAEKEQDIQGRQRIAKLTLPSLLNRFNVSIRRFLEDTKIRGNLPLGRARGDELLYVLRHLATTKVWKGSAVDSAHVATKLALVYEDSSRAHLFQFYASLLELSSNVDHTPSIWLLPSEHARLFEQSTEVEDGAVETREGEGDGSDNVGDGEGLIEVTARDLATRCLELIGQELGLMTA